MSVGFSVATRKTVSRDDEIVQPRAHMGRDDATMATINHSHAMNSSAGPALRHALLKVTLLTKAQTLRADRVRRANHHTMILQARRDGDERVSSIRA